MRPAGLDRSRPRGRASAQRERRNGGFRLRGRERKAVEVFNESLQYYGQLQQGGKIESVEAWFLAPHGGDLGGFILLRGEREQLDEIERSPEFERLQTRASLIVDRTGVVNAYTGESIGRLMGQFEEAAADLSG